MPSYYLPDLTGTSPDYLQVNIPFYIYQFNQVVTFENSPVHLLSIRIFLTDGSGTELIRNVDWNINLNQVDQTAMSRAKLENPAFPGVLVFAINFISNKSLNKTVAITYQEFYLTQPGRLFDDGTPFEVTPDLIKSLVTGLADVRQQVARPFSPVAPNPSTPPLLPFDINCEMSGNVVNDEVITVNTVAGAKVVRLSRGLYFADTLSLTYNGATLQPTTDYLPIGLSTLTKDSTNRSGIYQYILLIKEITGNVTVDYHAVGGDVQIDDFNALYELMVTITTFLNNNIFVTSQSIVETPAFRAFNTRLNSLENNMRSLLSGAPTYGDATAGSSTRRPVAAQDAKFHWYTIARLYKVQGSPDVITADQFKGRVFFPGAKVALGFTVDVNLNQTRNPASFKTDSLVFDPTYTLFGDLSVAAPVYPMLRLVWSNVSQSIAGCMLQVGIPLTSLSDQMVVEDLSTTQSCWLLDKTGEIIVGNAGTPSAPSDTNFVLPDNATIWSTSGSSSQSKVYVPQYGLGYLIYSGSTIVLSQLATTASTKSLFNVALPTYFPIQNISSMIVTFASPDSSIIYDVEIPLPLSAAGSRSGRATFIDSSKETISLAGAVYQDVAGAVTMSLNLSDINVANSNSNVDVVRYVRAKVSS